MNKLCPNTHGSNEETLEIRNKQSGTKEWRHLREAEITMLEMNGNCADRWENILVSTPFDPALIRRSTFSGLVRIGKLQEEELRFHDFSIPEGIYDSRIIDSDIGDHCSLTECHYLSHYIIGERVILHDISEMQTTDHAKFGVGIVKEGEDPSVRITLNVMNEAEGRAILPFDTITTSDAWLWAKHRDDQPLMDALTTLTDRTMDRKRGYYGTVGNDAVIKGTRIIKDVKIEESAYIKGANKLKNLTIHSREEEPTQLGEGIELVNGIIGYGCRIFYGCKAVRFVLGDHCNLKYGARLLNSVLGDNSTVSCCEVLSNLIFPGHEQHHNNSFLIAACIKGQSNMAAGANIGSNHNSRGADGELVAGRGFWPALSSTLKYDSKFASYTLIAKGNYPHELNVPLPFCLLASDTTKDGRLLMPAYWWRYNLYALERNSWKYTVRDKRKHPRQFYETDYLAPDTALEIIHGMELLEQWTHEAWKKKTGEDRQGKELLENEDLTNLEIHASGVENSTVPLQILKAKEGYLAYKDMLLYYGMKTICAYLSGTTTSVSDFERATATTLEPWENMGGQLVPISRLEKLKKEIKNGTIASWDQVHERYEEWLRLYPEDNARNAVNILRMLLGKPHFAKEDWEYLKTHLADIRTYIEVQVYLTKQKDYDNPFRMITYDTTAEREEVLGKVNDNPFIQKSKETTRTLLDLMHHCVF